MPSTELFPGSGVGTSASAQVLYRRHFLLVNEVGPFAPPGTPILPAAQRADAIREGTRLDPGNLPGIFVNLFLFPQVEVGGQLFFARNNIQWRPVYKLPPDTFPNFTGPIFQNSYQGVATDNWIPLCAPLLLAVAQPISFFCDCAGADQLAIEIYAPENQVGAKYCERVIVSMSASGS